MSRTFVITMVMILLIAPTASTLRADHAQAIGRYLGVGWSDGYHSHAACPPQRRVVRAAAAAPAPPTAKPLPWWMIPAEGPESLPAPHESGPATSAPGASLFRQPGEGSSVYPPPAGSIVR